MASELRITWDGTAPGLSENRLSIGAYGEPLNLLLSALRRIANQLVSNAYEGEGSQRGRLFAAAKNIDIEIVNIKKNSSGVDALVTFQVPPEQFELYATLADRSVSELIDDIERESRGEPANAAVRRYLRALPTGTNRQVYEVYESGKQLRKTEIGEIKLTEMPSDLPSLRAYEGNIIGVGFEPGRTEVRIKTEEVSSIGLSANAVDVEKALELRKEKIRIIAIQGKRPRLVGMRPASDPRFKFDAEAAKKHIFERWDNVLKQLAK